MSRRLLGIGALLIVVTIALWVADSVAWIQPATDDRWSGLTLKMGLIALGVALLLRILAPVSGVFLTGRCTVCGRSTKRGRAYCLDHLQETVNAARDQARNREAPRPRPVRSSGR